MTDKKGVPHVGRLVSMGLSPVRDTKRLANFPQAMYTSCDIQA